MKSTDKTAQQLNRSRVPERQLFQPWWSSPRRGPPLGPQHFGRIRTMQAPLSTRKLDKRPRRNRLFSMAKAGALSSAKISCARHHRSTRSSLQRQDLALRASPCPSTGSVNLIGPDRARKPREAEAEIPSALSATNSILIAYLANPSIREVDF